MVKPTRRARLRSRLYFALGAVSLASTVVLTGADFAESPAPPQPAAAQGVIPSASGAVPVSVPPPRDSQPGPAPASTPPAAPAPAVPLTLPASPPVSVRAATVGMQSPLVQVGLNPDGTIEVPVAYDTAAWYRLGPIPGSLGPAVIVGHVDSYQGPGVFFTLGAMRPGAIIDVTRVDATRRTLPRGRRQQLSQEPLPDGGGLRAHRLRGSARHHLWRRVRPDDEELRVEHRRLRFPGPRLTKFETAATATS